MAKQRDIKKCAICDEGMMHARGMTFYSLTIVRMGINLAAVRRQDALETLCGGSPAIAQALGPDEDLAVPLHAAEPVWICDPCAFSHGLSELEEIITAKKDYRAKKNSTQQAAGMADAGEHSES